MRTLAAQLALFLLLSAQAAEPAVALVDFTPPAGWKREVIGENPRLEKYTSADGTSTLGITSADCPPHFTLNRKGAKEGIEEAAAKLGMHVVSTEDTVCNAIPMLSFLAENDDRSVVLITNAAFTGIHGKMFTFAFRHAGAGAEQALATWRTFLASVAVAGTQPPQPTKFLEQIPGEAGRMVEAFAGFQHGIPSGWFRAKPDRAKTMAMLAPSADTAGGIIKVDAVEVARALSDKPDVLLFSFASDGLHIVEYERATLDGVDCLVGRTDALGMDQPQMVLVANHHGRMYLLMASAVHGIDVKVPMKTIMDSWKWSDQAGATVRTQQGSP